MQELGERPDALRHLLPHTAGLGREHADEAVAEREHCGQPLAQGVEPGTRIEAEHRAQHHLEGQALKQRMELDPAPV